MRAEYVVVSIIIAVIVLAIAISAVSGAPSIIDVIGKLFSGVPK